MKIAFDLVLMRPACVILQPVMGGDPSTAKAFNSDLWLTEVTEDMKLYPITEDTLPQLVRKTERWHELQRERAERLRLDAEAE